MSDEPGLLGREELLAQCRAGLADGGGVLLAGPAGVGKSAVLDAVAAEAAREGTLVLRSSPSSAEAALPYVALYDMFGAVLAGAAEELVAPHLRAVLDVTLLRAPARTAPDPLAVRVAVLELLRALAARRPVLVALDDAQCLDLDSAGAIGFAARRLRGHRVALAVAERVEDDGAPLGFDLLPTARRELPVGVLPGPVIGELLRTRLGLPAGDRLSRRIQAASGGNPYYALELAGAARRAAVPVRADDPLPVPARLRTLLAGRLAAVPTSARDALLLLAAATPPHLRPPGAGDGGLPEAMAAGLSPALAARVVTGGPGGELRFAHPLLREIVYADAGPQQRRACHARLAERLTDPLERARHRALATARPDAAVAAELARVAALAVGRGAPALAAELARLAAERTPADPDLAAERLLACARHSYDAGLTEQAAEACAAVLRVATTGEDGGTARSCRALWPVPTAGVRADGLALPAGRRDGSLRGSDHQGAGAADGGGTGGASAHGEGRGDAGIRGDGAGDEGFRPVNPPGRGAGEIRARDASAGGGGAWDGEPRHVGPRDMSIRVGETGDAQACGAGSHHGGPRGMGARGEEAGGANSYDAHAYDASPHPVEVDPAPPRSEDSRGAAGGGNAARVGARLLLVELAGGDRAGVPALLDAAEADAGETPYLRAAVLLSRADHALSTGRIGLGLAVLAEAERHADLSGDPEQQLEVVALRTYIEMQHRPEQVPASLRQAAALTARRPGPAVTTASVQVRCCEAVWRLRRGDVSGALTAVNELRAEVERAGLIKDLAVVLHVAASVRERAGLCAGAYRAARLGGRMLIDLHTASGAGPGLMLSAAAELAGGSAEAAGELADAAIRAADRAGDAECAALAHGIRGRADLLLGHPADAAESLGRCRTVLDGLGLVDPAYFLVDADLAESLTRSGRNAEARRVLAGARAAAERLGRTVVVLGLTRAAALLDAADGDPRGAADRLRAVLAQTHPYPLEVARARLTLGELERRARRRAAARAELTAAVRAFASAECVPWLALARERLSGLDEPGAVSDVERRIVELVATGATNRQIAAALHVSVKSVEASLTRLYRRFGVHGRTELTSRHIAALGA